MKKLLLIFLAFAFSSNLANSQSTVINPTLNVPAQTSCVCNPNGWQPYSATINGTSQTVRCGHQFSLKCNDKVSLKSEYKCVGNNCTTKYSAVLKNTTTGAVVQTYASFTFPWSYQFLAAGNYSLEITPLCGNTRCTPCRFFFTVTCPPTTTACDCNDNGWQPFISTIANNAPLTVKCNYQFSLKKTQPFKLVGKYLCKGTCVTKYSAVLKNNVTGAVVMNYPSFTFPWNYAFAAVGNYKLEITTICGDKRCQPCVFYFTVI